MLCCYATSVHQTLTKKMLCVVPENNEIISMQPVPSLMEGIGNSRGWGSGYNFSYKLCKRGGGWMDILRSEQNSDIA